MTRSVLIAEDSRIQAKVLEHRLLKAGFTVYVAVNGAIALELARQHRPDVIISDIEMPKMSGYDFCRAVKQDPALQGTPVVLLSTLSDAEDIIRGLDAGADNYVTKPYDPTYLLNRVESLLQTPLIAADDLGAELSVTIAGRNYRVKSGRQQVLNLLISVFESAIEKNRELYRLNEQLTLAKEKLSEWNVKLESLNTRLSTANDRMSRDLQAAARIQQSLLPHGKLEIPGAAIAWKYSPCEELAGDFLNYFPLDDKHLAMYVVDVSGHGAASSLLAVAVGRLLTSQSSATSLLLQPDPFTGKPCVTPPASVIQELNRRFPMESQGGLYFTIVYGVLHLESRQLRYVSAGHPPLVHVPRSGLPRIVPSDGFPVGWVDDVEYDEQLLELSQGDRVVLYSDGIPEAMDHQFEQFGDERMLQAIHGSEKQELPDCVSLLFDSVKTWCEPHGPKDDVSILAVELQ